LDNSNVTDLVDSSDGLSYPNGLTIHKDQLYWTAVAINKIQRADLDSSNVTDLVDQRLARNFYFTKVFASPDQRPTDLYYKTDILRYISLNLHKFKSGEQWYLTNSLLQISNIVLIPDLLFAGGPRVSATTQGCLFWLMQDFSEARIYLNRPNQNHTF
jgi:hypothetical protein